MEVRQLGSAVALLSRTLPPKLAVRLPTLTPDQLSKLDLSNHSSLVNVVVASAASAMAMIIPVVGLRLVLRWRTMGRFLLDDYLIMLASLLTVIVCSILIAATHYGLGKHIWDLDLANIIDELKRCIQLMYVCNILYALAIAFTKLSIVASYLHIFSPQGTTKYVIYSTAIVTIGLAIGSLPATIFECNPVYASWDITYVGAKCYTFINYLYASTAINVATDLTLCIVPIPCFWGLHLPRRQKIFISFLFFIGGFRLAYLHLLREPIDVTYDLVSNVLWTIAECTIGIVCVSLPALRSLLARVLPSIFRIQWTDKPSMGQSPPPIGARTIGGGPMMHSQRSGRSVRSGWTHGGSGFKRFSSGRRWMAADDDLLHSQTPTTQRTVDIVVMSSLQSDASLSPKKPYDLVQAMSMTNGAEVSVVISSNGADGNNNNNSSCSKDRNNKNNSRKTNRLMRRDDVDVDNNNNNNNNNNTNTTTTTNNDKDNDEKSISDRYQTDENARNADQYGSDSVVHGRCRRNSFGGDNATLSDSRPIATPASDHATMVTDETGQNDEAELVTREPE